jgi:hypothetical protein
MCKVLLVWPTVLQEEPFGWQFLGKYRYNIGTNKVKLLVANCDAEVESSDYDIECTQDLIVYGDDKCFRE